MGVEIKLSGTQADGDKVHAGLNEARGQQQALAKFMFAEPLRFRWFFLFQIKGLTGGGGANDIMGLCAKAVQAPDRSIEFFEALESRVQIIKESSL